MGLKKENTGGPASFRVCYRHLRDTALRAARRKGAVTKSKMRALWRPAPLRSRFGKGSYPGKSVRRLLLPNRDRKGAGLARNDEEARSLTVAALKCTESPRSYYATRLGALVVP